MFTCPVCNGSYKKIDVQHLRKHGLDKDEYFSLHPGAPFGASPETKLKNGIAVKSRGGRTDETKAKISNSMKGVKQVNTPARIAAIPFRIEAARIANTGSKRPITQAHRNKLSAILKEYYLSNPKDPYDKESERYKNQLLIVEKLAITRRAEGLRSLDLKFDKLSEWAEIQSDLIVESNSVRLKCQCNTCKSLIDRALVTYRKHDYTNTICHTCFPPLAGSSKSELEIYEFVKSLGLEVEQHNRNLISPLELDIFIPSKNIAIEFHGLYWHSAAADYSNKKHRTKYVECRGKNIRLIQIFEDEWLLKKELIKARLIAILGKSKSTTFARETKVQKISHAQAKLFLDSNHLQGGSVKSPFRYGLFKGTELLAVMTFGSPRSFMNKAKKDGHFELVRFASNGQIPGAFSKLLKAFTTEHNPLSIISYIDLRWSSIENNVYIKNNFSLISESSIGYYYTDLTNRFNRYGHRRPKDEILSEEDWNKKNGYYRIYDAGTACFQLDLPKIE